MAAAYGTIGNSGKYNAPTAIIKIVDRNGKVIFEHKQETKTVVDAKPLIKHRYHARRLC
ncbi:MAG: hypothetical protein ACLR2G_13765 [Phascolarctobacterium faecium]